jgi:outer membrane immunogenic protein
MRIKPSARAVKAAALLAFTAIPALSLFSIASKADALAPIWTGAYAGFHGGATWGDVDINNVGSFDTSAATGGGHAGFNLGFGSFVAGIEGDLNYDGSETGFTIAGGGRGNLDVDWNASLRGRIGVPVGPALLYATAGFAWTEKTLASTSAAGITSSTSHTFNGVVYGIGAETYVLPNLSVRLEALRYDYGSDALSFSGAAAAAQDIDPGDTVVRAGVTFHLN